MNLLGLIPFENSLKARESVSIEKLVGTAVWHELLANGLSERQQHRRGTLPALYEVIGELVRA